MEDKELEGLFKEGLSQLGEFSNAENQWVEVEKRLKSKPTRRFPIWILGLVILTSATLFYCQKNDFDFRGNQSSSLEVDLLNHEARILIEEKLEETETSLTSSKNDKIDASRIGDEATFEDEKILDNNDASLKSDLVNEDDSSEEFGSSKEEITDKSNAVNQNVANLDVANPDVTNPNVVNPSVVGQKGLKSVKGYGYEAGITQEIEQSSRVVNPGTYEEECEACEEDQKNLTLETSARTNVSEENLILNESEVKIVAYDQILVFKKLPLIMFTNDEIPTGRAKNEYEMDIQSIYKPLNTLSFNLLAGASVDGFSNDSIGEQNIIRPYVGLSLVSQRGLSLSLKYSQGKIEREMLGDIDTYQLPFISYDPTKPVMTIGAFRNESIDLDLGIRILKLKRLRLNVLSGVQFNKYRDSKLSYIYDQVYQTNIYDLVIPDVIWTATDINLGSRIDFALTPVLNINAQYQYHIPFGSSYRWEKRHRFFIGVNYSIFK